MRLDLANRRGSRRARIVLYVVTDDHLAFAREAQLERWRDRGRSLLRGAGWVVAVMAIGIAVGRIAVLVLGWGL
jgi:hypothetical protein